MTSTEISSTVPDLPAVDEGKGGRRGLKIFDVVWIGVLTFVLSFVLVAIYGVYLGTQGYTLDEIAGYFESLEGQPIGIMLGAASYVGLILIVLCFARWRGVRLTDFGLCKSDQRYFLYALVGLGLVQGVSFGIGSLLDPSEVARLDEANIGLLAPDGPLLFAGLVVVILLVPFTEELFFRAALYGALVRRMPPLVAVFLSTSLFTVVHTQYLLLGGVAAVFGLGQVFLMGLILAWLYYKSGSIWPSVFLHSTINAVACIAIIYFL